MRYYRNVYIACAYHVDWWGYAESRCQEQGTIMTLERWQRHVLFWWFIIGVTIVMIVLLNGLYPDTAPTQQSTDSERMMLFRKCRWDATEDVCYKAVYGEGKTEDTINK